MSFVQMALPQFKNRFYNNPNEPKPPTLSPSKIEDLTVGGFGVFRLIFGGLMEL